MAVDRIKFKDILSSQLPSYVRDDFPLLVDFLTEYYSSQEVKGATLDLIQNLDQYVKVDELANLKTSTTLLNNINRSTSSILTSDETNFTYGFPEKNGLIRIDNEIIKYGYTTSNSFEDCVRGFSGVTEYIDPSLPDKQKFERTIASSHVANAKIENLSILFLQEFFKKVKAQIAPGFDDRTLSSSLDQKNFIKNSNSFYKSKGTDQAFKILFKSIYGSDVEVIKPNNFLIRPSDADYVVSQDFVVEQYVGDPLNLKNRTIYQSSTKARGTVTKVEKLNEDGNFYQVSIDSGYNRDIDVSGTTFGKFEPNSKTKLLNDVSIGSTILDVDSTISFPSSGELSLVDSLNEEHILSYSDKNLTQFLGVTTTTGDFNKKIDVRSNDYSYTNVGVGTGTEIRVRITSTLKDINFIDQTYNYSKGDRISIKSIGVDDDSLYSNNWFYNVKSNYDIESVSEVDPNNFLYKLTTKNKNFLEVGYNVIVTDKDINNIVSGKITSIESDTILNVRLSRSLQTQNLSNNYNVENQILKGNSIEYLNVNSINSNILNVYKDNKKYLVASNSIPNYEDNINPFNRIYKFSGSANGETLTISTTNDHGLFSGDAVFYNKNTVISTTIDADGQPIVDTTVNGFSNVDELVYFVLRVDSFNIKLAKSKSDLFSGKFISPTGSVTDNTFTYFKYYKKQLDGQKIFREISEPSTNSGIFKTKPGKTGILVNGVEVLNYKSRDTVYNGDIVAFDLSSSGSDYDVINPPVLKVTDSFGSGAEGKTHIEGSLSEIRVINSGFDYTDQPIVTISGGSGEGAEANVNLKLVQHRVPFLAGIALTSGTGGVDTVNDRIGFSTSHNFRANEEIQYESGTATVITGISTNSIYFARIVDASTITLHNNFNDSNTGINTVQLINSGSGKQFFKTVKDKSIISSIVVSKPGSGYKNFEYNIPATGINTSLNLITIKDNRFENDEVVNYTPGISAISGLSSTTDYFVKNNDADSFVLYEVGVGSTNKRYYIDNNIITDLQSIGNGSLNYKPISVSVEGTSGVSTIGTNGSFNTYVECTVQPIFRGSVVDASVTSGGIGYGSSEIINFDRKPVVTLETGSGSQLTPIVDNGTITEIVVNNGGSGYNSPPHLTVSKGQYCRLTPIVVNGVITEVKVVNGGINYKSDSLITIIPSGKSGSVEARIKNWTINNFEKDFENISDDDGFLSEGSIFDTLEYSHLYAPRNLRSVVFGKKSNQEIQYSDTDLKKDQNLEVDSKYHSPIIGFAYDGNPIYGPFGYDKPSGGSVRRMLTGYELSQNIVNRPPVSIFPLGFFVEDYSYVGNGDLDESNGRFCITPDFPTGTFAYFATIKDLTDSGGPFKYFRRPEFPYLIGDTYHNKENDFNFKNTSNHVDYDLESQNWKRITTPYNINNPTGGYDYIFNSNNIKEQVIDITSTSTGNIESIGIVTGGFNYRNNDKIVFNKQNNGREARGNVTSIEGKKIVSVDASSTSFDNIEFTNVGSSNKFVGFTTTPHGLVDGNRINIFGLSNFYKGFEGSYKIGINTGSYILLNSVGDVSVTGMTTFFEVGGAFQFPFMRPNDIIGIGSEKVKVLAPDPLNGRVRVLRAQEGTVGSAHTGLTKLFQDPKLFTVNVGAIKSSIISVLNTEYYFDPNERVGVGSLTTIGAGKTLSITNPGIGITSVFVLEKQIYTPNHIFKINDKVSYNFGDGSPISYWNGKSGIATAVLSGISTLYVAPIGPNFIGLSTNKIGLSTTGSFVGVGTDTGLVYFTNIGTGNYHSLKTNFDNVITGKAERNKVVVSTASTHGLFVNDTIDLTLNPQNIETIVVKYNDYNRRIVFNPYTFAASDVNVTKNTIGVGTNTFKTGDKVIYTSSSLVGGLQDESMYYVYADTSTTVKFVKNKFELELVNPNFINLSSTGSGSLARINPSIVGFKNITLRFDLSDTSLSFTSNSVKYSAFRLELYKDPDYVQQFLATGNESDFEVQRDGIVGTDGSLSLKMSESLPNTLYYNFILDNELFITDDKKRIIDQDVKSFNTIFASPSPYDGSQTVSGIGTTSFEYELNTLPERVSYGGTINVANSEYTTTSLKSYGAISKIDIVDNGYGYKSIPGISSIKTGIGTGAIVYGESKNIGKILKTEFSSRNIGWNYPTDKTLKLTANLPEIVEINPLTSFNRIGISSAGKNYLVSPNLKVRDGFTNELVKDAVINYELNDNEVNIVSNTRGMFNVTPRIIATNNSNGFTILSVTNTNNIIRLNLSNQFSNNSDYPFKIGEKIIVEGISIGINTTGLGYNSDQYEDSLFEVVGVNTALGGSGAYVEYSLVDKLDSNKVAGNIVSLNGSSVTPESFLPIFDISLQKNNYLKDENVIWDEYIGNVDFWDESTDILKVKTQYDLPLGTLVVGSSSQTRGVVTKKLNFEAEITTGAGTTINYSWSRNTGFLNDTLQRIPNNEYYQRFSYSLKSEIPFKTWDSTVGSLNHTAGFKKYSDLQVLSESDDTNLVVSSVDSEVSFLVDIVGEGDLNCYYDFDSVKEDINYVNGSLVSNNIIFDNVILSDYFQSIGNRVLSIDDISDQFNSNERSEQYASVSEFDVKTKFNKTLHFIKDTQFTDERQFQISTVIQDDDFIYMQSYGTLNTFPYLGYMEASTGAQGWNFDWYPVKFEFNNYDISSFSFNFNPGDAGVASTSFGNIIDYSSQEVNIPAATTTTVVSVGTSYRSLKVLNLIVEGDSHHTAELNIVHDGTNVSMLEYGNMDETSSPLFSGIGTYGARISGTNIIVEFHPTTSVASTSYSQVVSFARGNTTTGVVTMNSAQIGSAYTSIPSSGSPTAHTVSSYDDPYSASYQIITVEDTANNQHEFFEFNVLNSKTIPVQHYVEWANVQTHSGLGTVGINTTGNTVQVVYTPNAGIGVEIRAFKVDAREIDPLNSISSVPFDDGEFKTQTGNYFGTKSSIKTDFNLTHNGDNIFSRLFDGSSTVGVNTSTNHISIPNHFFNSGEAVKYITTGTSQKIKIALTDFGGSVGSTSILPENLFVTKIDDARIGFTTSASDALKVNPVLVGLTTVGVGNSHYVTSTKQDSKVLISVDNMIQSPLSKTGIAATLTNSIVFDTQFQTSGLSTVRSNDVIKIDDEYMLVTGVVGSGITITVRRPLLGTVVAPHGIGATITKFTGNFTINDNILNFTSAPYGNIPLGTTTNPPDERDWSGISTSSTFSGRAFLKRGALNSTNEIYYKNHVFDDLSNEFVGIKSEFTYKSNGQDVIGITSSTVVLVNNIFQSPQGILPNEVGEYENFEDTNVGITSVRFLGIGTPLGDDANRGNMPIGGLIVSIGSQEGFGYQPLVAAGGTAIISGLGTVSSVSIGNSGSGYRTGLGTVYNVGVQTYFGVVPVLTNIGTALVTDGHVTSINITNPGTGFTNTNAPVVIIDEPLSYTNIPLEYSSTSVVGSGRSATIDIVVGQGSSVIDFEIKHFGYGYGNNEILTIPIGGPTGIPTDPSLTFNEFKISIEQTYEDQFNGYSVGEFQVLDRFDDQFDGLTRVFSLTSGGNPISIKSSTESNVEVDQTILIFINDILQVPRVSYSFEGGSQIIFNEAPKGPGSGVPKGDTSRVLFYKGAGDIDVQFTEILETVKPGDTLDINHNVELGQPITLDEDIRVVTGITTLDSVKTNQYPGPGISIDQTVSRPVTWCRQKVDKVINGQFIGKDREKYEPSIYPASFLTKAVSISTTFTYVDNVRPLFDANNESTLRSFQNKVTLTSQKPTVSAAGTAIVSTAGTVSSIDVTSGGSGYDFIPTVTIAAPSGITTSQAIGVATVTGGVVTGVTITGMGTDYNTPPLVMIQPPKISKEEISITNYKGDYGIIVGLGSTSVGSQKQLFFDTFIPVDSFMRNSSLVGTGITISGVTAGDHIVITDTFISIGGTFASNVGVATTALDCVYEVASGITTVVQLVGYSTSVVRITCNVDGYGSGIAHTSGYFLGNYSWGKLEFGERVGPTSFDFFGENGVTGISTSGLVQRTVPLKFKNYS